MVQQQSHSQVNLINGYQAFLFDMDGVLTDTASLHSAAWKKMFDEFLRGWSKEHGVPFQEFSMTSDYMHYVDGKPRQDGVRDFLSSRGIRLPDGDPTDESGKSTVWGLGNHKNDLILEVLAKDGVKVYEGSIALVRQLLGAGCRCAVVSSSANTKAALTAAGILDCFEVIVDGVVTMERGLAGKPAPDTFLYAAHQLEVAPEHAVVFEDALAGVEAGHAGGFGLVVGVDRVGQAVELNEHGADLVVEDLGELLTSTDEHEK